MEGSTARRGMKVDPSKPTIYLCYECGDMFTSKLPYDEHILVHQAVSLCHQIYYFETKGIPVKVEPFRSLETSEKEHSSLKSSKKDLSKGGSLKERRGSSQASRIQSRRTTVTGVPPRKRSFGGAPKRKFTDPLPDSLTCLTKRRPIGRPRSVWRDTAKTLRDEKAEKSKERVALSDNNATIQHKPTVGNGAAVNAQFASTSEASKSAKDGEQTTVSLQNVPFVNPSISEESKDNQQQEVSSRKQADDSVLETNERSEEMKETNTSEGNAAKDEGGEGSSSRADEGEGGRLVKRGSADALSKVGAQTALHNRAASPNTTAQKCLLCDYRSCQGWEMVEHIVREHKVSIAMVEKTAFEHGQWTARETLVIGEKCSFCPRSFSDATDFYLHSIVCHRNSMFTTDAKRLNCVVHMAHPNLPIQRINITMRRP